MQRHLMFNPGPTNVHEDVRRALLAPDANHRDALFGEALGAVRAQVTDLIGLEATHTCIPFVSSGTGVNEGVLANIRGTVVVPVAGRYSARLADICERLTLPVVRVSFDPLDGIDIRFLEAAIAARPDITHLCLVHHETTTGAMAPLDEIVAIADRYGLKLIVDGISSIFGHDLGARRSRIDYYTLTANKCLESVPGLSFVIARRALVQEPETPARSYYFDLNRQWRQMELQSTPLFTHGYASYCAAQAALHRLVRETVAGRCTRYRRLRDRLKFGLASLGIEPVTLAEDRQSNWLQLYRRPPHLDFRWLRDQLIERGFSIYTDPETLANGYMYFATMGAIDDWHVDLFLDVLREELCAAGMPDPGPHRIAASGRGGEG